jgi:hypothetical protein
VLLELADLRTRGVGRSRYADLLARLVKSAPDETVRLALLDRMERNLLAWAEQERRIAALTDALLVEHRPSGVGWA